MNPSPHGSEPRGTDLRAQMEARIQHHRQRPVPLWLASRGRRRGLALIPAATFVLGVLAASFVPSGVGLVLLLLMSLSGAAGMMLLRRVTQLLDAAPPGLLDEREIPQRDQAYRRAHWLTLTLVGVMYLLAVVDVFMTGESDTPVLRGVGWILLTLTAGVTVSMLPAAALAWSWDVPPDSPHDDD